MRSNAEIKNAAKQKLTSNYWMTVAVCVIASLVVGLVAEYSVMTTGVRNIITGDIETVHTSTGSFGLLYKIFIGNIISVGLCSFLVKNGRLAQPPELTELISGFKTNYVDNLTTLFFRDLYLLGWTLLLVIPGIVKAYEYAMIPYLLAEFPGLERREAFARSRQLMDGKKMKLFSLHLSFIGWFLVSLLTAGILTVFWVGPYMSQANAEFYLEAKNDLFTRRTMQQGSFY